MAKLSKRLLYRLANKRRIFQCLLMIWLTSTFVVLITRKHISVSFQYRGMDSVQISHVRDDNNSSSSSNTTEDVFGAEEADIINVQTNHTVPVNGEMGNAANTIGGFINAAKTDPAFMNRILNQKFLIKTSKDVIRSFLTQTNYSGYDDILEKTDPSSLQQNYYVNSDVIVFLHIQKTGGTRFNKRLQTDLRLPFSCSCRGRKLPCTCRSGNGTVWMYSSVFAGWPCGLHADWTQLHRCIPERIDKMEGKHRDRRYFYFTQLRNPLNRYLSEWRHQHGGHHWQDAILGCGDGYSDWSDVRPCFHGASWKGVSLDEFLACPHNLATNRQARMLADLTETNCYRNFGSSATMTQRASGWLKSAFKNLQDMEYFGLMEEGPKSDELLYKTYGIKFRAPNGLSKSATGSSRISEKQFKTIIKLVELDIHVYTFAKQLLHRRYESMKR